MHYRRIVVKSTLLAAPGLSTIVSAEAQEQSRPNLVQILTGQTPFRNGVWRWIASDRFCRLPKEKSTLPQLLRTNGYQTAHFGKWHLSYF